MKGTLTGPFKGNLKEPWTLAPRGGRGLESLIPYIKDGWVPVSGDLLP